MIKAGMVGLGWWGQTLVESVSGESEDLQFVAGAARTHRDDTIAFAKEHNLRLHKSFEEMLDEFKRGIEANLPRANRRQIPHDRQWSRD